MQQYISSPKRTTQILTDYGIRLRKNLGQNYMIDTNSIKKMVSLAKINKDETVLEIGSGIGSLTEVLLESGAGKVLCVEIDKKVSGAFRNLFKKELDTGRAELIISDAMDLDYRKLSSEYGIKKMVSNIPYKIAAPLMLNISTEAPGIGRFWMTIQKDIADRMIANKGDKNYSSYSVKANLMAEYRICFKISRNCFIPRPFVDSVVVEAARKMLPEVIETDEEVKAFFDLVNNSFLHRRKKMLNSLSLNNRYKAKLDLITGILKKLDKDLSVRAEDLTLEDYIYIFENLK
jgi:16S rRNA (adenine1518-N6/adenine1519-N6)-dimethyltransferase